MEVCVERNAEAGMEYLNVESRCRDFIGDFLENDLRSEIGWAVSINYRNFSSPGRGDHVRSRKADEVVGSRAYPVINLVKNVVN